MANAKKCDRCGKLYEPKKTYPFPQIKIVDEFSANNQRAYLELNGLDLCFECESYLKKVVFREDKNEMYVSRLPV